MPDYFTHSILSQEIFERLDRSHRLMITDRKLYALGAQGGDVLFMYNLNRRRNLGRSLHMYDAAGTFEKLKGAKFQSCNIRRLIQHEGYTGYIITRAAKSEYMPQLQIVDDELFTKANEMMDSRCKTAAEQRNAARKSGNPTLLAGIVVCVHCGAKMSAFLHKDRYKLADGTIRENVQAKYNCYQRGQHLRPCDGQSLYLAERVDGIVLDLVDQMFQQIKREPYDRSIEQRIRQQDAELNRKKVAAEKKIQAAQHKQQRYEEEIVRCLDGKSAFSESTLARLIQQAEAEVQQAKNEYTALLKDNSSRTTVQQIRKYYDEFLGWANEFDLASIPRKRTILAQLLERVEVGKGYRVRIVVKGSYRQFLAGEGEAKEDFLEGA